MDDLGSLTLEFIKSPASVTYWRLRTLQTNFYVFQRNHDELCNLLNYVESPDSIVQLWVYDKQDQLKQALREIIRYFLNYVASAYTIKEHTRAITKAHYSKTRFMTAYEYEVNSRFISNPLHGFVEDLRNYSIHYRLPPISANFIVKNGPENDSITNTIVLDKDRLLEWPYWKCEKGRPFLEKADDKIPVTGLVDQHYSNIENFHLWFFKSLQDFHAEDIKYIQEITQKVILANSIFTKS